MNQDQLMSQFIDLLDSRLECPLLATLELASSFQTSVACELRFIKSEDINRKPI
jgi:hypothetical protein